MTQKSRNFVDLCLTGDAIVEDIYDFVDRWHESESSLTLPEYLGMTADEYARWLERPESLPFVIAARRRHVPAAEAI